MSSTFFKFHSKAVRRSARYLRFSFAFQCPVVRRSDRIPASAAIVNTFFRFSRFFFCPAKRCGKRTADAGRNDDAMRLGPARASKERFSRPERRILHGGRPYMVWNGHGVQPASSVLTFTAGVHACYQFIRFTHLKFSKPMAVLCIDEKVWQAFVGRLETLAERARLLEHRYEPRTDSS